MKRLILFVQSGQDGFKRLAAHGCRLISSVAIVEEQGQRQGKQLAPQLVDALQELVECVSGLTRSSS
jgi:hypothetical protein